MISFIILICMGDEPQQEPIILGFILKYLNMVFLKSASLTQFGTVIAAGTGSEKPKFG